MEEWIKIKAAADDPYAYARGMKQDKQKPMVGYFCSYAPEEIILAAGTHPFRLWNAGPPRAAPGQQDRRG